MCTLEAASGPRARLPVFPSSRFHLYPSKSVCGCVCGFGLSFGGWDALHCPCGGPAGRGTSTGTSSRSRRVKESRTWGSRKPEDFGRRGSRRDGVGGVCGHTVHILLSIDRLHSRTKMDHLAAQLYSSGWYEHRVQRRGGRDEHSIFRFATILESEA